MREWVVFGSPDVVSCSTGWHSLRASRSFAGYYIFKDICVNFDEIG